MSGLYGVTLSKDSTKCLVSIPSRKVPLLHWDRDLLFGFRSEYLLGPMLVICKQHGSWLVRSVLIPVGNTLLFMQISQVQILTMTTYPVMVTLVPILLHHQAGVTTRERARKFYRESSLGIIGDRPRGNGSVEWEY